MIKLNGFIKYVHMHTRTHSRTHTIIPCDPMCTIAISGEFKHKNIKCVREWIKQTCSQLFKNIQPHAI